MTADANHDHRGPIMRPLALDDGGFTWPCMVCKNAVHDRDALVGEWSCRECDWKAVAWAVCSQRCMDRLWTSGRE
jgi:hypothetical protein